MQCPVCRAALSPFEYNGVEVDICQSNQCGIWFDHGEVKAVETSGSLNELDKAFPGTIESRPGKDESFAEAPRHCPRHGQELERYEWNLGSGIVLDRCPRDGGIWMDAGEVESYAAMVKKFRQAPPELTPELEARLKQARQRVNSDFDQALDQVTHSHVKWDAWLIDDALRFLMAKTMKPFL